MTSAIRVTLRELAMEIRLASSERAKLNLDNEGEGHYSTPVPSLG